MADPYRELWGRDGGLFLGFEQTPYAEGLDGRPFQVVTSQNWLMTGPAGSGKSRRVIMNAAKLLTGWSIVFVDIKGDLYAGTAKHRRDHGCKEILIDPYEVSGKSTGHNPVAALKLDDDLIDEAGALSTGVAPIESMKEPHFDVAAQEFAQGIIQHARIAGTKPSLTDVRKITARDKQSLGDWAVKASVESILAKWPEVARMLAGWTDFGSKENRERESVLASLRNKTRWLDSRRIAADLKKGTTDWAVLRERPHSVYLTIPANRLAQQKAWLKVIIQSIMQRLLADATPPKVPILFVLDEASYLAGIPSIEQNMALLRAFGIKLLSVYQDIGQANIALSNTGNDNLSRLSSYVGNAGIIMGFSPQEMETAEFLAKQGGKRTGLVHTHSGENTPWTQGLGQLSTAQQQVDAILPQEVMDLPEGYAVAFVRGRRGPVTLYCPDPAEVPDLADRIRRSR